MCSIHLGLTPPLSLICTARVTLRLRATTLPQIISQAAVWLLEHWTSLNSPAGVLACQPEKSWKLFLILRKQKRAKNKTRASPQSAQEVRTPGPSFHPQKRMQVNVQVTDVANPCSHTGEPLSG